MKKGQGEKMIRRVTAALLMPLGKVAKWEKERPAPAVIGQFPTVRVVRGCSTKDNTR
jgi:hypothetical protein